MREARSIILAPVISEKSYEEIESARYSFRVDMRANKTEIGKAVAEIFNVTVLDVNTMRVRGKRRRMGWTQGRTSDWKKAIITLKKGDKIDIFEK